MTMPPLPAQSSKKAERAFWYFAKLSRIEGGATGTFSRIWLPISRRSTDWANAGTDTAKATTAAEAASSFFMAKPPKQNGRPRRPSPYPRRGSDPQRHQHVFHAGVDRID